MSNNNSKQPYVNCALALAYGKKISPQNNISNYPNFRFAAISMLCKRELLKADAVIPIPHAGVFLANCWAEYRTEQLWLAFGYKKYESSMFKIPNENDVAIRYSQAEEKTGKIIDSGNGIIPKSVFLIDEGIISGITMKTAISALKKNGVEKIFVRTILPPFVNKCPYSIVHYTPTLKSNQDVAEVLGIDGYSSLSIEDLLSIDKTTNFCSACI